MRILIVEDNRTNLAVLISIVSKIEGCDVEGYANPLEAMEKVRAGRYDLVLIDFMMPQMNGIEFITQLRTMNAYKLVPVVMVTADDDRKIRLDAIAAGATDFLNKPVDSIELRARVKNLLALRQAQLDMADHADWLAREVAAATQHLADREEEVIWRLARAIEYRDGGTGEHISRVARISRLIAEGLGLSRETSRNIYLASPLHDVGKIGIADAILSKPGKLTPDEMSAMREHVNIGARILEDGSSDLIRVAASIAATHHEKWDGTGYPAGLEGTEIPIEGRISAVADVFDALCSERPYKPAWPIEAAYQEIIRGSGTHFDPACIEAFKLRWREIAQVMNPRATQAA